MESVADGMEMEAKNNTAVVSRGASQSYIGALPEVSHASGRFCFFKR